jgi:hypothetical protein
MTRRQRRHRSPSQNIVVTSAWQTPAQTTLRSDPDWETVSWPFGDDLAEVMTSLDAEHLDAWEAKVRDLAREESRRLPPGRRVRWLKEHARWVAQQRRRR